MAWTLLVETSVGLPRSNLLKSRSLAPTVERLEFAPTELEIQAPTPIATSDMTGPTPQALLERAAELGPARLSWESIVLPNDPVLRAKSEPEVAERRARLRRVVKGTLGVCGGMCLIALVVSIVSGGPETANAATAASVANTVPAKAEVPVTKRDGATRTKAAAVAPAPVTTVAARRFVAPVKRR